MDKSSRNSPLRVPLWVCASVAAVVAMALPALFVTSSIRAEQQLQAVRTVDRAIAVFVRREGRLPRDWDELRTVSPSDIGDGYYLWPRDFEPIKERISIEFSTQLATVQKQGVYPTLVAVRGHIYYDYNDTQDFSHSRLAVQEHVTQLADDRSPGPP